MLQQLKILSGEQFLAAFKLQQVEAHTQAILLVQAYAESGENAELRDWAGKTLPTLRTHLAEAQQLPPNSGQPPVSSYIDAQRPTPQPAPTTAQAPAEPPAGAQGSGEQPATANSQAPAQQ